MGANQQNLENPIQNFQKNVIFQKFFLNSSGGWKLMESQKNVLGNKILVEKKAFLEAVNQLKKTSDCIKTDPPGPGRNLEKSQKKTKKWP